MTTPGQLCNQLVSQPGIREAYRYEFSKKDAANKLRDDSHYLIRYDSEKKCLVLQLKNNDLYYLFPVSKNAFCVGGPSNEAGYRYPNFAAFKALLEKIYGSLTPLPSTSSEIALNSHRPSNPSISAGSKTLLGRTYAFLSGLASEMTSSNDRSSKPKSIADLPYILKTFQEETGVSLTGD